MNNKRDLNFLALILFTISIFKASDALSNEKLIIAADYWCPYNCEPSSDNEGYIVEITKIALNRENIEVIYQLKSWAEAVSDFNKGNIDGLFGANERDLKEAVFPSIPQAESRTAAFTLNDTSWIFDGESSLEKRNIGLIEAYAYPLEVKNYLYTNFLATPEQFYLANSENSIQANMTKLLNREIFTYIEDENVVTNYNKANNLTNIRHAGVINLVPDEIFVAFSKTNPQASKYAKLITAAMLDLKSSGELNRLKAKYNIKNYNDVAFISR